MNGAALGTAILRVLQSKWFWYTLLAIAIAFVIWKFWASISDFLHRVFRSDTSDYTDDPPLTAEDKTFLDGMANRLFTEMDGWNVNPSDRPVLAEVHALNDRQLKYCAQRYPDYSDGIAMSKAIDEEAVPGDMDADIIGRLHRMNM